MKRRSERVGIPLAVQQGVEYLLGLGLIMLSLHGSDDGRWLIVATGAACAALAAITKGPLGAVHLVGPRLHRVGGIAIALAAVAAAVVAGRITTLAVAVPVVGAAAVLIKMATGGAPPPRRTKGASLGIDAESVGRMAGRASGQLVRRWRERDRDDGSGPR